MDELHDEISELLGDLAALSDAIRESRDSYTIASLAHLAGRIAREGETRLHEVAGRAVEGLL